MGCSWIESQDSTDRLIKTSKALNKLDFTPKNQAYFKEFAEYASRNEQPRQKDVKMENVEKKVVHGLNP